MRVALARGAAVLVAIAVAAAACGSSDPATPSPAPSVAGSASASDPPSASPSSPGGAESQAEFCADLHAFTSAAGPAFDLGALALIDGETPNERRNVSQLVDSIALHGALIKPELPADLADDLETVVVAAGEAKTRLAKGAPAAEAVDLLQTKKAKAARDAVVKYRGSC